MNGSIENVVSGDGNDYLIGSSRANKMYGMRGNDRILGMDGDDIISGGQGNDILDGGAGADTFVFNMAEDTGRDSIRNFEARDRLAFNQKLADPDGDGKIELQVFENYGVSSMLRLDDRLNGDRITFENIKIKALYLIEEKDGMFVYGMNAPAKTAAPTLDSGFAHAEPAVWTTGFDAGSLHQTSLFIA
ncbi:hypothetical protein [Sphingomonas phyllosphaerae]|uniref:hypothetical protein n=1 Tax=Sphingomonas phyllosphaerae TaxID=257003 RepID=UPI0003FEE217|nr:hypothetical protein [Sphingomonas phyllosphaerae]